jgi:type IV secretory pathway VirB2 component (pilin)
MKQTTERRISRMERKFKAQIFAFLAIALFTAMPLVMAVDFSQGPSSADQQTFNQILEPVMKIYNLVKYVASVIAALALLFAGITYMMSGSDPKKRDNAKSMAMYVIIGLVVIWAAPLVVNLIVC